MALCPRLPLIFLYFSKISAHSPSLLTNDNQCNRHLQGEAAPKKGCIEAIRGGETPDLFSLSRNCFALKEASSRFQKRFPSPNVQRNEATG
jgi:hypothetical protein